MKPPLTLILKTTRLIKPDAAIIRFDSKAMRTVPPINWMNQSIRPSHPQSKQTASNREKIVGNDNAAAARLEMQCVRIRPRRRQNVSPRLAPVGLQCMSLQYHITSIVGDKIEHPTIILFAEDEAVCLS